MKLAEASSSRTAPEPEFQPLRAWLEYAGLWAIAIAYPLFHGIASGPEALAIVGAGRLDVILLILLFALIPPVIMTGVEFGIAAVKPPAGIWFRAAALGLLLGLVIWQALLNLDSGALARMGVPLVFAGLFSLARLQLVLVRNFTEILAIAMPVVIIQFCVSAPVKTEVFPHGGPGQTPRIESGTPVVLIVLDEFSLPVIERSPGKIDAELFPGFARLAKESTWYPNALAAADMSSVAVPAIMTGERPKYHDPTLPPSMSMYPDNLCSELASGGYTVDAFESITNLCGQGKPLVTRLAEMVQLGSTTPIVPGRLINRTASKLLEWTGEYNEAMNDRGERADNQVAGLEGGRHRFDLLHLILPHSPWEYMPSGQKYEVEPYQYVQWGDSQELADAEMQRMMAQLQFVDRRLRAWSSQVKKKNIWQDALVVITADHGVNFTAGENGRILNSQNAGAVLPVPLFVKYPNQTRGRTDSRPASSLDIAPTIDAVIGADPPNKRDGRSLALPPPQGPSEQVDAIGLYGPVELSRRMIYRQRREVVAQTGRLFGSGSIFAVGGNYDLLGKQAEDVSTLRRLAAILTTPDAWNDVDTHASELPVLVEAKIPIGPGSYELPQSGAPPIAISVNGRIATTNRTWKLDARTRTLRVIVPAESLRDGTNWISIFAITKPDHRTGRTN